MLGIQPPFCPHTFQIGEVQQLGVPPGEERKNDNGKHRENRDAKLPLIIAALFSGQQQSSESPRDENCHGNQAPGNGATGCGAGNHQHESPVGTRRHKPESEQSKACCRAEGHGNPSTHSVK
ncbi:hypothetical protein SDC9_193887 [bioreactor metagenome]|uniref:Uncharacterized protein n=1 Tax=bioreactor metagenome TaxID=1076179 RepID=A0A645I4S7_9ZZZZ